jgi:serine/threonine protein kinase
MTQLLCGNCGRDLPEKMPVCQHCGVPVVATSSESSIPEEDDRHVLERLSTALSPTYLVRRLIGRGGFCDVFEIYDHDLDRRLAVKVLRADLAWAPGMIERFEREARALARLNHPNIPPLYFVGDAQGLVYFAMPFIEGRSLGDRVRLEGPMDPAALITIMIPVLDALDHAHRHGIIHRDIKPDNVIIEAAGARPLLVDFGLAKQMSARPGASLPGLILGTPAYSSPEQVLAQPGVDHRSDIYAIGSTMFHVLTGRTIVAGNSPAEVIGRQLTAEIPVPSRLNPDIPSWLSDLVLCALERRPEDRFQSAVAMAVALKAGVEPRSTGPRQPTGGDHIRRDDPTPPMRPGR